MACPFCHEEKGEVDKAHYDGYYPYCGNDECIAYNMHTYDDSVVVSFETEELAIAAWNNRTLQVPTTSFSFFVYKLREEGEEQGSCFEKKLADVSTAREKQLIRRVRNMSKNARKAFDDENQENYPIFWENRFAELKIFSKRYPKLVFILECTDEVKEDWTEYYHNGELIENGQVVFA